LKFSELNLSAQLNEAIEKLNYKDCTPIQEQAIPYVLEGKDIAGLAQTGTGKTAAFLLPLIERVLRAEQLKALTATGIKPNGTENVSDHQVPDLELIQKRAFPDWKPFQFILALVPTRELAEQVYENFCLYAVNTGLKACSIYGGTSYEKQKEGLKSGVTLVVATPGRLIDLYKEHLIDLKQVRAVVFDEADRMFDMGFKDDMKYLLQRIPNDRQFLVFSATLNFDVLNTAYQFGANPIEVNISRDQARAENVEDSIFHLGREDKPKYLLSLMKFHQPKQCVIFSNFKNEIEPLVKFLRSNKVPALGISSLLTQAQRNKVLQQFKEENETQVLVATDVAARGLDIQGIDMVINYELPQDCETYVHRIGRTGRAGLPGKAFSFVGDRDVDSLMRIEEYLKHKITVSWLDDQNIVADYVPLGVAVRKEAGYRGGDRKFSDRKKFERTPRSRDFNKSGEPSHRKPEFANDKSGKPIRASGDQYRKKEYPRKEFSHENDHLKKTESSHHKRDFSQKRDFTQKRYNKPQTVQGTTHSHNKAKSHLPSRPGVYKINLWYRIVKFFKKIF
jgi:ATP-dependent RNA helicase RhlB